MPGNTTCSDIINQNRYVEDFICRGVNSSEHMLKEMRLSFPSGHASFSAYTMIYAAVSVAVLTLLNFFMVSSTVFHTDLPPFSHTLGGLKAAKTLFAVSAYFDYMVHLIESCI